MKKIYIIRKFVYAENTTEAMKMDSKTPVHEVYLEEESIRDLKYTLSGNEIYKPKLGFEKDGK